MPVSPVRRPMLIGGELVPSESGAWMASVNPVDEEVVGHAPEGTAADVARAAAAAHAAARDWGARPVEERASALRATARPSPSATTRSSPWRWPTRATPRPPCAATSTWRSGR